MPQTVRQWRLRPGNPAARGWVGYLVALSSTVAAGGLYLLLDPILQPAVFLLLTPAVVFSAWFGGRGPAIAASLLSIVIADSFYYASAADLTMGYAGNVVELVIFLAIALLVSSTMESLHHARAEAEVAHDRARAAVKDREEVLAVVTHDLRNLVGTAQTTTRAVLDLDLAREGRGRELLERATRVLAEGDRLINDLLDVSQSQGDRLELRRQKADVAEIVRHVASTFEEKTRASGIELAVAPAEGLPPGFVDPDRLARVCYNLVGNAIKHTLPGGRVAISLRHDEAGDLVISISDTGPGIRPEDRLRLFEPFWRGAGGDGAGLGLAIARTLVEAHGGRIWMESPPGRGSTFSFSVPTAPALHSRTEEWQPDLRPGRARSWHREPAGGSTS